MTPTFPHDDAGLDERLDRLAAPVMSADLIARIVRNVPQMPQFIPEPANAEPVVPRRTWRLALGGGLAALAAGVAAVALVGSPAGSPVVGPRTDAPAPQVAVRAVDPVTQTPGAKLAPERLAAQTRTRTQLAIPAPVQMASTPVPVAVTSAAPQELASVPKTLVVAPVGPEPDDVDDIDVGVPAAGVMGPPVPRGMGYANGSVAPSMPGGTAPEMTGAMPGGMRRGPPPR
jgi:hypothetical protein